MTSDPRPESETADPVTVTVTVTGDPVTVTADPVTVTADPLTVTADPVTVRADPVTTTLTATVPTTLTSLATTTALTTVTTLTTDDHVAQRDGLESAGAIVKQTQTVTQVQTDVEKVVHTDRVTNIVEVTRYNAAAVNPMTGQTPAVIASASQVSPGDVVRLSGSGYTPGEQIRLTLHSDPVLLTTVEADDKGEFETAVTIPIDTELGQHTIQVVGVTCGVETSVPLTVVAAPNPAEFNDDVAAANLWPSGGPSTLSYTGVDTGSAGTVAAILIGVGMVLVVATRRRSIASRRHRA